MVKKEAGVGGQDQPLVGQYWWCMYSQLGAKRGPDRSRLAETQKRTGS